MLPLRLCYLIVNCVFNEHCNLPTSPYKDLTDTMLSGFNVSLVAKSSSLYSPANDEGKEIDECLLSIQRNESDAVLLPYTMPLIMNNIKTGPVFFSDKIAIASTYKVENDNPNPGIFTTFDAFGLDALALIVNFFFLLGAIISFTFILEHRCTRPQFTINGRRFNLRFVPWFILSFFVKQFPSFPGNMTALKVLLTCCLLTFSYYVTFFYSAMIKTDMVTVKAPKVIASYQDIVDDPSIVPYIRHTFDEYVSFKQAPSGSLKRQIWDRIVKMGVNKLVYNDDTDASNSDDDIDTPFFNSRNPFMRTKAVIMAYGSMVDIVKYSSALHFKSLGNRRGLCVSDPTESAKLSASVVNRLTKEDISKNYERRMRRFFEGHFYHKFLENTGLQYAMLFADMTGLGKDISDAEEYANQRVVLPDPVLVKPNINYFIPLFILYLVLCVIQLILFLIERWVSNRD